MANVSPTIVVRPDGLALISYLKYSFDAADDTDLYYAAVNVVSGELEWNIPAPRPVAAKTTLQPWSKSFKRKVLGTDISLTANATGVLDQKDCDVVPTFTAGFSITAENEEWARRFGLGDVRLAFLLPTGRVRLGL